MLARETVTRRQVPSFYFDPICPWTWITSRWLVEVAETRQFPIVWRSLSLSVLNGGIEKMPQQFQEGGRFSRRAQRVIEAIRASGDNELIGALYTQIGTRLFVEQESPSAGLLEDVVRASGARNFLAAAGDTSWDAIIAASTEEAMQLAGPDVGSPILRLAHHDHGLHGPIVSPAPSREDALRLWDMLVELAGMPDFYEFKRGRTAAPDLRPARVSQDADSAR